MIYFISEIHFIFLPKNITLEKFVEKAKVKKDSYAERFIIRIFNSLTFIKVNIKMEYEKYYSKEYDTFEKFLYKKYPSLNNEILIDIKKNLGNNQLILYRGNMNQYGDNDTSQLLIYDDNILSKVEKLLMECLKDED